MGKPVTPGKCLGVEPRYRTKNTSVAHQDVSCLEVSAWSDVLLGQTCSGTRVNLGISACS